VPPRLESGGIGLRPEAPDDAPFLQQLYVSTRWTELAVTGWPDEAKLAFLHDQFRLQRRHYTTYYVDTDFAIIEHERSPIGRLYLDWSAREVRIVDVALLPEWRGQGIGGALLQAVLDRAGIEDLTATIHVEHVNPAQRLYQRLGFQFVEERGPYWLMAWQPPRRQPA